MARPPSRRRAAAFALAAALAACSSSPRLPNRQRTTLAEINRALSWHFADVTLTDQVVMRGLRAVEVIPERLLWTNERGQRREMPIAEVARIVLRGRDPGAQPPSEGARMLKEPESPGQEESEAEPFVEAGFGALDGATGAVVGVALGVLALSLDEAKDPGVLIYEAPVTRYLAAAPHPDPTTAPDTLDAAALPPF